ncbi:unnamed protein product [Callosobruchus maculatus]|uniref:RING-type domain-containing protein n=1 Tax=Callosobruchus maculatus TaxID=64391 RepID=A0A653DC47_CALMS|nr:unnamed protein product [Callosobruchus maculatus]
MAVCIIVSFFEIILLQTFIRMASPTPSLESLPRANSIGSFGDQHEYLSLSPLADSPLSVSGSSPPVSDSVDRDSDPSDLHCQQCREPVSDSKLLACFHTFCNACLEKNKFVCPRCNSEYPEQFAVQL